MDNKKEVHLRIDKKITSEIEKKALLNNKTFNEKYIELINQSLLIENLNLEINKVLKILSLINNNCHYNKSILEQIYADLNLNVQNPELSVNLIKFKSNFKKGKNNLND